MAREKKFRAWLPNEGKMTRSHTLKEIVDICSLGYPEDALWLQFTGLTDKNGVEIYEGDIIEATERRYFFGQEKGLQTIRFKSAVIYEDAGFVYSTTQENDSPLFVTDEIIVIGNIHEHPELLTTK